MYGNRPLALEVKNDAEYGTSNPAAVFHFPPCNSRFDRERYIVDVLGGGPENELETGRQSAPLPFSDNLL